MRPLVLGTRGSDLALAQSRQIAAQLKAVHPGLEIEERVIRTTGDERKEASLPAIGGKGVFTLEIEAALLNGEIDFAVHSLKDLPPDMPPNLCLAAVPQREAPEDVVILHPDWQARGEARRVPERGRLGTSSLRRAAMVRNLYPQATIEPIRGNVGTRLQKLESQNLDAIVLARAGLQRLHLEEELAERIVVADAREFIPAPGQGALAIQARSDDELLLQLLVALEDNETRAAIVAERAVVRGLNAGCSTPLGALATVENDVVSLHACVLSPDGATRVAAQGKSIPERAAELGAIVAQKLADQGARELLS